MRTPVGRTDYVSQRRALAPWPRLGALALALLVVAGCGGGDDADASDGGGTVSLVAYSTPREAYEELFPCSRRATPAAASTSRSPTRSGEQRRAIEEGLPADLVHLSLEPDVTSLADAGMVDADWNQNEYDGMLTNSVVVFAVRPGTPRASRPGTTCSATASR